MEKPIYMDHHATTPLDPEVLAAMMPFLTEEFGNPSSNTHVYGHAAREAVERAREQVAALINAGPQEIIFTSGATESDNLALKGCIIPQQRKHPNIVTIPIEHKAVLDPAARLKREGVDVRFCRIDSSGLIDLDDLQRKTDAETVLVAVQAANSEIGTLQPIKEIAAIAHRAGALFFCDAVQALGRVPIDVRRDEIDMLAISGHKIYGPKGVGALYVRKGIKLTPLIDGGGHERGMRSGTLNVPGIVGLGQAAELALRDLEKESRRLLELRLRLQQGIERRISDVRLNGHPEKRLPNNLNYSFAYVEGEALLMACRPVALSSGSACTSATLKSSYVLKAIGVPEVLAHSSIRIGLGKCNTEAHVDLLLDLLEAGVKRLREMSPLYDMAREGIDLNSVKWSDSH